ncbi:MAG: glucosamine-6-phosphate deaminase [Eubacteriales bacterium]
MQIYIEKDYCQLSNRAAKIIADEISKKSDTVLGLATGSTPIGTYRELVHMCKEEGLDFSQVVTFNLDEYYGISSSHEQSYHYYMQRHLFDYININENNVHIPDGKTKDVEAFCILYDEEIKRSGGIDFQILGIGENGHIGFNEPDYALKVLTHLTKLSESTIKANSRFFNSINEVPDKAITMGLGSIMRAKKIMLLASGRSKASIIDKILTEEKTSPHIPASSLLLHNNVTMILDEEAAYLYRLRDLTGITEPI